MICPAAYIEPEGQIYFCSGATQKELFQFWHGKFEVMLKVKVGNNLSSPWSQSQLCWHIKGTCLIFIFLLIRKCSRRNGASEHWSDATISDVLLEFQGNVVHIWESITILCASCRIKPMAERTVDTFMMFSLL